MTTVTKCGGWSRNFPTDADNHITNTGFTYDAAGNTTADGNYNYAYNAENEITSAAGVNYT